MKYNFILYKNNFQHNKFLHFFRKNTYILKKKDKKNMVITIRLTDWILFIISLIMWIIDHWFIAYGISHLCPIGVKFMPHTLHCFCSLVILCSFACIVLKSFKQSFLHGFLIIFYCIFLMFSAYIWDYLIMQNNLLFGLLDMLFSVLITISVSIYFSKESFTATLPFFPIFLWRFFLTFLNFLCFYTI